MDDNDNDNDNDDDNDDTHPPRIIVRVGMVFRRGQKNWSIIIDGLGVASRNLINMSETDDVVALHF